ncbi:LuxR C-terminal-related transcriptional regulator [Streptomyces longwoodensis]|uniref:LuxR C-terminal-related transcriptional regulator n=1 Tax=Streptomyces longwoodensis TaxID=68231 RepID=UPI0030DF4CD7
MNRASRIVDVGILVSLNRQREIVNGSAELFQLLGGSSGEICGRQFRDFVHPAWREPVDRLLVRLFDGSSAGFTSKVVLLRAADSPLASLLVAAALWSSTPAMSTVVLSIDAVEERVCGVHENYSLSEIDIKILEGIAMGLTSEVLASRLFVSRQTVEYHIGRLLRLSRMPNRVSLVAYFYSVGVMRQGVWPPRVVNGVYR